MASINMIENMNDICAKASSAAVEGCLSASHNVNKKYAEEIMSICLYKINRAEFIAKQRH